MRSLSHSDTARRTDGRQNWLALALIALLLIVSAFAAVKLMNQTTATVNIGTPTTLPAAQARWQQLAANHYAYTVQLSCFCIDEVRRPVRIVVRDGQVESMTVVETGAAADAELFARYAGAANLFGLLADAEAQGAARIDASYDAQTGLPTSVYVDYSEMIADEELALTISNIELLP